MQSCHYLFSSHEEADETPRPGASWGHLVCPFVRCAHVCGSLSRQTNENNSKYAPHKVTLFRAASRVASVVLAQLHAPKVCPHATQRTAHNKHRRKCSELLASQFGRASCYALPHATHEVVGRRATGRATTSNLDLGPLTRPGLVDSSRDKN